MSLTEDQFRELVSTIKASADDFLISIFGDGPVSQSDLRDLIQEGLIPTVAMSGVVEFAYVLGKLGAILKSSEYRALPFTRMKEIARLPWAYMQPLSDSEKLKIQIARQRTAKCVVDLEPDIAAGEFAKLSNELNRPVSEMDVRTTIAECIAEGIQKRLTIQSIASAIGRKLFSYCRDWQCVAATETHAIAQQLTATQILHRAGRFKGFSGDPLESEVYVRTTRGACEECRKVYLNQAGIPRIFRLVDLLAAGSDHQRARNLRIPMIPPYHDWCMCDLGFVLPGHGFDDDGNLRLEDPIAFYGPILSEED